MTSFLDMVFSSTSLPESSSVCTRAVCLPLLEGRKKLCDPDAGVWCPYVREPEECDFLFEEKRLPRRRKDLIDGNETTMMATAISVMERTSIHVLATDQVVFDCMHLQTLVQAYMTSIVANRSTLIAIVTIPSENVATRPQIWRRRSCSERSRGNGNAKTVGPRLVIHALSQ